MGSEVHPGESANSLGIFFERPFVLSSFYSAFDHMVGLNCALLSLFSPFIFFLFGKQVDQEMLFEIILAANYLDIKPLLDVGCKTVANMIKGKSPEEIRKLFNIKNDFTPEEEEQIKRENEWAEDR